MTAAFRHLPCILVFSFAAMSGCTQTPYVVEDETTGTETSTGDGDGDPGDGDGDPGDGDGDPGDGDGDGDGGPPEAAVLELSLSQVKQFDFDWMPAAGADYYQLLESADMGEPFVQIGSDVMGLSTSLTVPLHFRLNASYKLAACNADGCTESAVVDVVGPLVEAIGYFKASNTGSDDQFGHSVALSGDGNTLAISAFTENSGATGIGGDQADNTEDNAGAVYVFVRDEQNAWSQQAYVKASNTDASDLFGHSVALSGDGNTLAVGAWGEDSIGSNETDNSASESGAVYMFVRDGQNAWSQQAYVKASNTGAGDYFGYFVDLSMDGNTLAVASPNEDSNATGINGNQTDNATSESGAVYVYVRNGQGAWSQQAYFKASNTNVSDFFAQSVALSGDGNTLAVGAPFEDSSALNIGGDQFDESSTDSGAVYVYMRDGQGMWSQQAYVKASNTGAFDYFGKSVALSGDGSTLAVGAFAEDSIGVNQSDNSAAETGAVYVYVRSGQNVWSHQAYLKASNAESGDQFGVSGVLSADGNTLAVGANGEDSGTSGVGGDQANNAENVSGAVYVFVRDDQNAWSQQAYVKASNAGAGDEYGVSIALSGDGTTLAVGARAEDSGAMGIGGDQADNSLAYTGAVYLY